MVKLTPARVEALRWFEAHGKACMFGPGEPSLRVVRGLVVDGLLEEAGRERGKVFGFTYYQISDTGRAALAS